MPVGFLADFLMIQLYWVFAFLPAKHEIRILQMLTNLEEGFKQSESSYLFFNCNLLCGIK